MNLILFILVVKAYSSYFYVQSIKVHVFFTRTFKSHTAWTLNIEIRLKRLFASHDKIKVQEVRLYKIGFNILREFY